MELKNILKLIVKFKYYKYIYTLLIKNDRLWDLCKQ